MWRDDHNGLTYAHVMSFLLPALLLGLSGSVHCVGMCGPIVIALPHAAGSRGAFVLGRLMYNLGRTATYTALGALFGGLGRSLHLAGFQQALSIACGVLILAYLATRWIGRGRLNLDALLLRAIAPVQRALARRLAPGGSRSLFTIGLLNGLLPCGLVYVALAGAAATGCAQHGALFMALFGLGTTPLLFALALAGPQLHARLRGHFQWIIPAGLLLLAALFILRGLNLGIPYISPHLAPPSPDTPPACCSGH